MGATSRAREGPIEADRVLALPDSKSTRPQGAGPTSGKVHLKARRSGRVWVRAEVSHSVTVGHGDVTTGPELGFSRRAFFVKWSS
jgi:hypothetical protein